MKEQFCSYEIALKLKELGFDEVCLGVYNRERAFRFNNVYNPVDRTKSGFPAVNNGKIPVPLWQQAINWLEEKHNLIVTTRRFFNHAYQIYIPLEKKEAKLVVTGLRQTSRAEAIENGISVAINTIKEREKHKELELCQKEK